MNWLGPGAIIYPINSCHPLAIPARNAYEKHAMTAPVAALQRFWNSSIGKKLIVALTGLVLVGFLVGHLTGNLLIYVGREAMNDYAEFLHHMLHGAGVWMARVVLLVCFAAHIIATVCLTRQNRASRDNRYQFGATVQASRSSRIMIWSGLTILAFVIFHLLHYTVRVSYDAANFIDTNAAGEERFDVYKMMIVGFSYIPSSLFYIIAIVLLCSHLGHGVASIFQTLGLRTHRNSKLIGCGSQIFAWVICAGFISIPLAVLFKIVTE